jgi:hypothetical protein
MMRVCVFVVVTLLSAVPLFAQTPQAYAGLLPLHHAVTDQLLVGRNESKYLLAVVIA